MLEQSYLVRECMQDMSSHAIIKKLHAVCVPAPYQSHISAMLKLAKLLHHIGFHITFVNTDYNHRRLLKARGPDALKGLPDFQFRSFPDGLPVSQDDASQDLVALTTALRDYMATPFHEFFSNLVRSTPLEVPAVTCVISDGFMSFATNQAMEIFNIPVVHFWTMSACSLLGFKHFAALKEKGLAPLIDVSYLTNGYLDTLIDWIPGMPNITLRDLPTFLRTTDPNDVMFNSTMEAAERTNTSFATIFNTFEALESKALASLSTTWSRVYSIGPLPCILKETFKDDNETLSLIGSNLWKEDTECLKWLDTKEPNSVIYVTFGSVAFLTQEQLVEFAMGLARSEQNFLWVVRLDLVNGETAILPSEFYEETKGRGLLSGWCPQEEVLKNTSIAGLLTHCGWSSIMESVTYGVPMLCWPAFGDQSTNSHYVCYKWEIGLELPSIVKRDEVGRLVKELIEGDKGKKFKKKAKEWKKLAEEASSPHGSSTTNLDKLINELLD